MQTCRETERHAEIETAKFLDSCSLTQDSMFGEMRPHLIQYYLVDDTMEVREVHEPNDGRDPFPVLIGRHKVPKDRDAVPPAFPLIAMEISAKEVKDYFKPHDLGIGKTVEIYGRRFLLYDCDQFTKAFFYDNFGTYSRNDG